MEFVEPIRKREDLDAMTSYFKKQNERDYLLFMMGINVAFRISDLLKLKVSDVKGKNAIRMREMKTDKLREMVILPKLKKVIEEYCEDREEDEYLFKSLTRDINKPISRMQAYRVLKKGANFCRLKNIGTHSFRKTFGYHFYQNSKDVVTLMKLFNHHDPKITLRYIGVERDELNSAIKKWGGF